MTEDFEIIKPLPNGWRQSPAYSESKDAAYVKRITEELRRTRRIEPRPVPAEFNGKAIKDLSSEEREAFLFSMQPESTKQAIEAQKKRRPSEDIDHLLRPMPACLAVPDAKTKEELVGERQLKASDVVMIEGMRRQGGFKLGESKESSVDPEKRDRGIWAYTYSKSAVLSPEELKKVTKAKPLENATIQIETSIEEKLSFWERIFGRRKKKAWSLFDSSTWKGKGE